jgi:predicted nucleic acid-binding protein
MMRIFLDASNWFTAAFSLDGGSAALLCLAEAGLIDMVATPRVLAEAEKNIKEYASSKPDSATILLSWYDRVNRSRYESIPDPSEEEEAEWAHLVVAKDRHVLAGALKAQANVLLTYDRRHLLRPEVIQGFSIPIQHPQTFFQANPDLQEWVNQNFRNR